MKTRKAHRVPLCPRSVELLQGLPRIEGNNWIFPSSKGEGRLSDKGMVRLLQGMGYKPEQVTVHGFRSTFRDWASESTAYPNEVLEMALAHKIENKVEAAYRCGDLLEKRRSLMAAWATYCNTPRVVVPLRRAIKTDLAVRLSHPFSYGVQGQPAARFWRACQRLGPGGWSYLTDYLPRDKVVWVYAYFTNALRALPSIAR